MDARQRTIENAITLKAVSVLVSVCKQGIVWEPLVETSTRYLELLLLISAREKKKSKMICNYCIVFNVYVQSSVVFVFSKQTTIRYSPFYKHSDKFPILLNLATNMYNLLQEQV